MKKIIHNFAIILVLATSVLAFDSSAHAKNCKKGKACGNTCIAQDAVCTKDEVKPAKNCKKGKPCGNTCIAKDAVCTK